MSGDFDTGTWVDQSAAALGVDIAPEHRAGVIEHLERAAALAETLMDAELDVDTEPAPIFVP